VHITTCPLLKSCDPRSAFLCTNMSGPPAENETQTTAKRCLGPQSKTRGSYGTPKHANKSAAVQSSECAQGRTGKSVRARARPQAARVGGSVGGCVSTRAQARTVSHDEAEALVGVPQLHCAHDARTSNPVRGRWWWRAIHGPRRRRAVHPVPRMHGHYSWSHRPGRCGRARCDGRRRIDDQRARVDLGPFRRSLQPNRTDDSTASLHQRWRCETGGCAIACQAARQ
jgi:hypothetical protein